MENLLVKYRPCALADVLGQPQITRALSLFARSPYEAAMLFHGESGVGKTSAALALAQELGVAVAEAEMGGLWDIPAGEMSADQVRAKLAALQYRPLMGSGWKVLVCNEADRMSAAAETIWLDALEHLPPRAVVIFTTNRPERLSRRLRDRCEVYGFESEAETLAPHIKALARKVWKGERLKGAPPALETLGMPTLGNLEDMHASFRLALQQLTRYVREARLGDGDLLAVETQLARDGRLDAADLEAACDHCGAVNKLGTAAAGRKTAKCMACGKRFKLEVGV